MPQKQINTIDPGSDRVVDAFGKSNDNATDSEARLTSSENHAASTANPHGVTAAQAGALTQTEADALYKAIGYIPAWTEITGKPTQFAPEAHKASHATGGPDSLVASDIGAIPASEKGAASGVAPLDAASRIPSANLPPVALSETFVVNSETAQLGLTAQEGDVAVRTDLSRTYIHNGGTAGTIADWTELATPPDAVQSVNAKTGTVSLAASDVGARPDTYVPAYSEITGKPTAFNPTAHKTSHATGGADAIAPTDIGAREAKAVGAFHAYGAADQLDIPNATFTKVLFPSEEADADGWFANSRYTPLRAGYYSLSAAVAISPAVADKQFYVTLFKNGARYKDFASQHTSSTSPLGAGGSVMRVFANGTADHFEIFVWHNFGVSTSDIIARQNSTYFSGGFEGAT